MLCLNEQIRSVGVWKHDISGPRVSNAWADSFFFSSAAPTCREKCENLDGNRFTFRVKRSHHHLYVLQSSARVWSRFLCDGVHVRDVDLEFRPDFALNLLFFAPKTLWKNTKSEFLKKRTLPRFPYSKPFLFTLTQDLSFRFQILNSKTH